MLEYCETEYKKYWEGKYLRFIDFGPLSPAAKTRLYQIRNVKTNELLGAVKWFSIWRKYTFEPIANTVFDERCLLEVSEFIVERTKEYKSRLPRNEKAEREKRMALYRKNRLTKEQNSGRLENVNTVPEPENQVVEGLTPLEVQLGTIEV